MPIGWSRPPVVNSEREGICTTYLEVSPKVRRLADMKRITLTMLITLSFFLTPIQNSSAATTIGGIVNSDLVLTKSQSPYLLSSTLQIPAGFKVIVEAGVEIQSNGLQTMFWNQGLSLIHI